MKIKLVNSLFVVFLSLSQLGCKFEVEETNYDYENEIYSWYSKEYKTLKESGGKFFLYFDDQLTCITCKLTILSKVREESQIWIITRFESKSEINAFKQTYKLENPILNLPSDQRNQLGIPFLFKMMDISMKDLLILKDEELSNREWLDRFIESS